MRSWGILLKPTDFVFRIPIHDKTLNNLIASSINCCSKKERSNNFFLWRFLTRCLFSLGVDQFS